MVHIIEEKSQHFGPKTVGDMIDMLQSLSFGMYDLQLIVAGQDSITASEGSNGRKSQHYRFRV